MMEVEHSLFLCAAIIVCIGLSLYCASYMYHRKVMGLILALSFIAIDFIFVNPIWMKSKMDFLFLILLGISGISIFFGAALVRQKFMQYMVDFSIILGVIYSIVNVIRVCINKEQKSIIAVWMIELVFLIFVMVIFGMRIVVNTMMAGQAESYDNSVKIPIRGEWVYIDRKHNYRIRTILNRPRTSNAKRLPLIVNIHGGSWIAGTASEYDRECQTLADELGVNVVNLDYRLLYDKTFPNQQQEVVDMVHYYCSHADEYGIDPNKVFLYGQSAGGHIAAGASVMLTQENFPLRGTVLFYPFCDFTKTLEADNMRKGNELLMKAYMKGIDLSIPELSPGSAPEEILKKHCPVFLEIGSDDVLKDQGEALAEHYMKAGVDITVLRLKGATHAFIANATTNHEEVVFQKRLEEQCMTAMEEFVFTQLGK